MPPPKGLRRLERWLVGLAMAIVAWVLERIVNRGLKKKGEKMTPDPTPTTLTSRGGSVDLPE
jgi:hypothetical protein